LTIYGFSARLSQVKKILPLLVLAFFLIPLYPAYAKDGSDSANNRELKHENLRPIRGAIPAFHPGEDKLNIASSAAEIRDKVFKNLEVEKTKIASLAAQRRLGLEKLKNQKKAQSAIKISDTLNSINQKRTDQLTKYLANLTSILEKIQGRVNEASASGKDITPAQAEINFAQGSITNSQSAVDAQKIKDYTVSATSEAQLRVSAQTQKDALMSDLKNLEKLIRDTKQTVITAASASAALKEENK
jgi:hypothetical protein